MPWYRTVMSYAMEFMSQYLTSHDLHIVILLISIEILGDVHVVIIINFLNWMQCKPARQFTTLIIRQRCKWYWQLIYHSFAITVTLQTGFMLWQNRNMSWDLSQQIMCRSNYHIIQCHYTPTSCKVKKHVLQYTPGNLHECIYPARIST